MSGTMALKESSARMAEVLRGMKSLQQRTRQEGKETFDIRLEDLFSPAALAALDLYASEKGLARSASAFGESAPLMAERLETMKKLQQQARDMQAMTVELHVEELFEAGDQAALDLYERELAEATGQVPLPMERVS